MSETARVAGSPQNNRWVFHCPGCDEPHIFDARWKFNGDVEKPTFQPSLLLRWTQTEDGKQFICHSFVTEGRIVFLQDSTHALAGKTVDLEPWSKSHPTWHWGNA